MNFVLIVQIRKIRFPAFTKFYLQESTKKPRSLSWHNLSCNLSQKNYQLCTVAASNIHDSTKFVDVLENTLDLLGDDYIKEIVAAYADKGYDAKFIRDYLKSRGMKCRIPYKKSSKLNPSKNL